jgi:hypothetical protein
MTVYMKNLRDITKQILEPVSAFSKITG